MSVKTYEGIVEDGQIHLKANVQLPEKTRVYVVVPETSMEPSAARVVSPRLAHPAQLPDFQMEVSLERDDASL